MELNVTVTANDGRKVRVSANQAKAIEGLNNTRKGGCASVVGYIPASNWEVRPVHDIQLITHFSTAKLYERRVKALAEVKFGDVMDKLAGIEKFNGMSITECSDLFTARKRKLIEALTRTLADQPKNAHREAHDRCYAHVGDVKVHLRTEKVDGLKEPVTVDGEVICESIMVPYLELNVTERKPGKRKTVNSGAPVLMEKLIEGCLNKRSVVYKTLSLKADNFETFRIDKQEFVPEDVVRFGDILT